MGEKGKKQRKYSAEFKLSVILDMREQHLSYSETVRKYRLGDVKIRAGREMIKRWERIYLEGGAEGLMEERRGKACSNSGTRKGRPPKMNKKTEDTDKYEKEKQEIQGIFNVNKGRYGYRRVLMALRNRGYVINHKTVLKLMNKSWTKRQAKKE